MKDKKFLAALAAVGLVLGSWACPVLAQDQNGPPPGGFGGPGGPPPDGFGGGPGGNGGPGGFGRGGQTPLAAGTVQSLDAASQTLTIADGNNSTQVIKIGATAQIVTQQTVTVADLKIGDQIAIQGVPTVIVASQIVDGQPPAGLPGAGGGPGQGGPPRGNFTQPRATAGTGGTAANAAVPSSAVASAQGTIKSVPTTASPLLAVSIGTNATLYLKLAAEAKLTKYTTLTFDEIKAGDRVIAAGQAGTEGTFTATTLGVNLPQATRGGRGGFNQGGPPQDGFNPNFGGSGPMPPPGDPNDNGQ